MSEKAIEAAPFKPMADIPMSLDAADNLAQSRALLVTFPDGLHPDSKRLVQSFAEELGRKLRAAEEKYGYRDGWLTQEWQAECLQHMHEHIAKGDPRDVAVYCAFMWARGWPTAALPQRAGREEVALARKFIAWWDALPGGNNYSPQQVERWLKDPIIKELVDEQRAILSLPAVQERQAPEGDQYHERGVQAESVIGHQRAATADAGALIKSFEIIFGDLTATERKWLIDHIGGFKANAGVVLSEENDRLISEVSKLEKRVYVPGQWRCAKCNFRLMQSNLYVASGTVGPRDEPGDKCPNCNGPLWRVSAMEDLNEAYKTATDMFERADAAEKKLEDIANALPAPVERETLENMRGDYEDSRRIMGSDAVTALRVIDRLVAAVTMTAQAVEQPQTSRDPLSSPPAPAPEGWREIEQLKAALAAVDAVVVYYVSRNWPSYSDRERKDKTWTAAMMEAQGEAFRRHTGSPFVGPAPPRSIVAEPKG
jgi:uncharacterized protein with PIN domain